MKYEAIVIGVSSGGLKALGRIIPSLPAEFKIPVLIVQHLGSDSENFWIEALKTRCRIRIKEADEKEPVEKGCVYVAPANYHLLVEADHTLSLSTEAKVNYARPSVNVLFESAAEAYGGSLIGIILTGSNDDGTAGMKKIQQKGGLTIVEDPATAESTYMPSSVIAAIKPDHILPIEKIITLLTLLDKTNH